jgi:hypothetical protein
MITRYHQARGNELFSHPTEPYLIDDTCVIPPKTIPEKRVQTHDGAVDTAITGIFGKECIMPKRSKALITAD